LHGKRWPVCTLSNHELDSIFYTHIDYSIGLTDLLPGQNFLRIKYQAHCITYIINKLYSYLYSGNAERGNTEPKVRKKILGETFILL
jgi:hypothetical protein